MIYISVQVLKNVKSNDVIYCVSHISCSDVYDTIYGLLSRKNVCTYCKFSRPMLTCYLMHDPFLLFKLPVAIVNANYNYKGIIYINKNRHLKCQHSFMILVVHDNILSIHQHLGNIGYSIILRSNICYLMLQFVWFCMETPILIFHISDYMTFRSLWIFRCSRGLFFITQ